MSLRIRAILVVVIGTILGVSLSLGGGALNGRSKPPARDLPWEQARLLAEVMDRVKRDYVEPIDDNVLLENAIRGMVADLDRHSAYLDADEYQDIRVSTSGRYTGVGIEVSVVGGAILVVAPIDGTPAHLAGIMAGDEILAIDDTTVADDGLEETIKRLRGRAGTTVAVSTRRPGYDDPLYFNLTRKRIDVASVRYELLENGVGYLRLSQFNQTTADEVSRALDTMMESSQQTSGNMLTGLILDLRNNPGGILDSAVDITDLFLDEGIIVSAEGRSPESRFVREASLGDILDGAAIAVLVNGGSASASEIVAGALQDHNRATIVGTKTFGKGLVQTVMPLSKGRAIKLTTSRYFTPSGDSINETGVEPDLYIEDVGRHPDQRLSATLDREGDLQLLEALELLQNRPIIQSQADD